MFDKVLNAYPDATLTLVGDGPERERLTALAGDRLGRSIRMPGALYGEDALAPLFLGADLYLLSGAAGLSVNHLARDVNLAACLGPFSPEPVYCCLPFPRRNVLIKSSLGFGH